MARGRVRKRAALGTAVLAVGVGTALAAGLVTRGGADDAAWRGSTPPARILLPAFTLGDDAGNRVSSGDLRGKVVAVTFLDTQCRAACPVIAGQVGAALSLLSRSERRDVVALAISADPVEDTQGAVAAFLRRHRVRGRLHYLVGSEPELRPVWSAFDVLPATDTGDDDVHSAPVRIYDRAGVWVSTQHVGVDLTPENLAHDLRLALRSS